jgi:3-oxoacid CoA-transferase subunit A/glutaconate CoA-transferase subunit A
MCYLYRRDEDQIREWVSASKEPETTQEYLEQYIYGVQDHSEYQELIGRDHLQGLRRD